MSFLQLLGTNHRYESPTMVEMLSVFKLPWYYQRYQLLKIENWSLSIQSKYILNSFLSYCLSLLTWPGSHWRITSWMVGFCRTVSIGSNGTITRITLHTILWKGKHRNQEIISYHRSECAIFTKRCTINVASMLTSKAKSVLHQTLRQNLHERGLGLSLPDSMTSNVWKHQIHGYRHLKSFDPGKFKPNTLVALGMIGALYGKILF